MADAGDNAWGEGETVTLQVLANVLATQNRLPQAATLLEYLARREPGNDEVRQALAGVYLMMERHGEALATAEEALAAAPRRAVRTKLMLVRAKALWGVGREREAEAAMRAYIEERQTA